MKDRRETIFDLRIGLARVIGKIPGLGNVYARLGNERFVRQFVPALQRLNDVLADTELAGKYWVWSGMLLGWAREGRLLAHDRDADFGLLPEDVSRLQRAAPALRQAGFVPHALFRNNEGLVVMFVFLRRNTRFEFYVMEPVEDMLRYYTFDLVSRNPIEIEARIPQQELAAFEFLGRTWLRHVDFDHELACMYGDWRTPQHNWNYLEDDLAMVSRCPWTRSDVSWTD